MYVCMHARMRACSIAKRFCNCFTALRKGQAMVLQDCEGSYPTIICARCAKHRRNSDFFHCQGCLQLFCSLAKRCRNGFAALRGFLHWLCFAALRGGLAMPLLRFLIAKRCHKGFAALRGVSAMAPVNVKYCNNVRLSGSSLLGFWG